MSQLGNLISSTVNQYGMKTNLYYDHDAEKFNTVTTQDVTEHIEHIKALNSSGASLRTPFSGQMIASIPMIIIDQYMAKGINLLTDEAAMRQFLNDPDNSLFRTGERKRV